jgi:hypothetical protein
MFRSMGKGASLVAVLGLVSGIGAAAAAAVGAEMPDSLKAKLQEQVHPRTRAVLQEVVDMGPPDSKTLIDALPNRQVIRNGKNGPILRMEFPAGFSAQSKLGKLMEKLRTISLESNVDELKMKYTLQHWAWTDRYEVEEILEDIEEFTRAGPPKSYVVNARETQKSSILESSESTESREITVSDDTDKLLARAAKDRGRVKWLKEVRDRAQKALAGLKKFKKHGDEAAKKLAKYLSAARKEHQIPDGDLGQYWTLAKGNSTKFKYAGFKPTDLSVEYTDIEPGTDGGIQEGWAYYKVIGSVAALDGSGAATIPESKEPKKEAQEGKDEKGGESDTGDRIHSEVDPKDVQSDCHGEGMVGMAAGQGGCGATVPTSKGEKTVSSSTPGQRRAAQNEKKWSSWGTSAAGRDKLYRSLLDRYRRASKFPPGDPRSKALFAASLVDFLGAYERIDGGGTQSAFPRNSKNGLDEKVSNPSVSDVKKASERKANLDIYLANSVRFAAGLREQGIAETNSEKDVSAVFGKERSEFLRSKGSDFKKLLGEQMSLDKQLMKDLAAADDLSADDRAAIEQGIKYGQEAENELSRLIDLVRSVEQGKVEASTVEGELREGAQKFTTSLRQYEMQIRSVRQVVSFKKTGV